MTHSSPTTDLKKREVVVLDMVNDDVDDYREDEDPKLVAVVKTRPPRGPLRKNWMVNSANLPMVTAYKLVRVKFKWFGVQTMVESSLLRLQRKLFLSFNRRVFCWMDQWADMSLRECREFEDATYRQLEEKRLQGHPEENIQL